MSEFSINEKNNEEVLRVPETQQPVSEPQHGHGEVPQITLENVETYKFAVKGMREKLVALVNEGFMTEVVAERIITDFMLNTFNQLVKPTLG
jgi:hypothetical protein